MEWQQVRLGDYISIKSGLAYQGSKIGKGDSILLGMGCVSYKDKFVESGARPYDDVCDDRYTVKPGDLVLATRQQSDNLPILAMPAVIPDKYKDKRVIFGTNLYKVDNQSEISSRFLYWLFKHQHYVNYIASVKSGTAVQMVTKKNVEDYKFLCPSKEERERIASILSTYDSLIENNTRRIRLLEQMAENLYKEWFVRFRFPGHEDCKMVDGIPEGWRKGVVGDTIEFQNGFAFKSETFLPAGKYKIVTIKNVKDAGFDGDNVDYVNELPSRLPSYCCLQEGDVLLSLTGNVGRVCRVCGNDYLLNQRVAKIKSRWRLYAYCLFKTDTLFNMLNSISYGTAQLNLSPIKAARLKLVVPNDKILDEFESMVQPIFSQISSLQSQNASLARQRDLLLPRLMSGKIEV